VQRIMDLEYDPNVDLYNSEEEEEDEDYEEADVEDEEEYDETDDEQQGGDGEPDYGEDGALRALTMSRQLYNQFGLINLYW
jgi:hypothetical protein